MRRTVVVTCASGSHFDTRRFSQDCAKSTRTSSSRSRGPRVSVFRRSSLSRGAGTQFVAPPSAYGRVIRAPFIAPPSRRPLRGRWSSCFRRPSCGGGRNRSGFLSRVESDCGAWYQCGLNRVTDVVDAPAARGYDGYLWTLYERDVHRCGNHIDVVIYVFVGLGPPPSFGPDGL